jgi:hypothetical protein
LKPFLPFKRRNEAAMLVGQRKEPTVALGYAYGTLHGPFVNSLMTLREYEVARMAQGQHVYVRYRIPQAGLYIDHNRNIIVEQFMEKDADWLLMIDTDISFPPNIAELMIAAAGKDRKIVAASVPLGPPLPSSAWMMTEQPGIWRAVPAQHWCPRCANEHYSLREREDGWDCVMCGSAFASGDERLVRQQVVTREGIPVDGLATAVILIHRDVILGIADQVGQCWFLKTMQPRLVAPQGAVPIEVERAARSADAWMKDGPMRDRSYISVGEDLSFCLRAKDAGFQSWAVIVPGLKHHKVLPMTHDYEQAPARMAAMEAGA